MDWTPSRSAKQKHPDFVIMDVNMPVMTGLEAARVIYEDKLAGFVMILTAYRDKEIADQAVDMDVMGYIVKPGWTRIRWYRR